MTDKAEFLNAFNEAVGFFALDWDAASPEEERIPLDGKYHSIRAVCTLVLGIDDRLPDEVNLKLRDQLAFVLKQKLQWPGSYGAAAAVLIEQINLGGRGERLRPQ
jgi:hypothetical protein